MNISWGRDDDGDGAGGGSGGVRGVGIKGQEE